MALIPFGFWKSKSRSIIQDGLILYQDAANTASYSGTGTNWEDLINGIDGNLQNGPVWNSAGYFTFDGSNDVMEYLNTNTGIYQFGTNNFTMSCWVYIPNSDQCWTMFRSRAGSGFTEVTMAYGAWLGGSGLIFGKKMAVGMIDSDASDGRYLHSTDVTGLNNWVNLTYVRDGGRSFKTYANGSELTLTQTSNFGTANIDVTTNANWKFSDITGNTERFDSNVSEIWWYNRALSAAEVLQNYNTTKARYGL